MSLPHLRIDIVSDVICPWCLIGKTRLGEAERLLAGEITLDVHWRPFQLDGTIPPEGKDRRAYLEAKFGGPEGAKQVYDRIKAAGAQDGIDFRFDLIRLTPNTLDAHRLIRSAGETSSAAQNKVVTELFRTYFLEGGDLTSADTLLNIAAEAGLDREEIAAQLESGDDKDATLAEIAAAGQAGIGGVPCFIVDEMYAIEGAQPSDALVGAFREIVRRRNGSDQAGA